MADNKDIQEATRRIKKAIETGETKLSLKDLKGVTSLSDLDVDIAAVTSVTDLNLSGTQITDLTPIAGLTGIKVLDLRSTPITNITPIAGMTGITTLYLDSTRITDLTPISGMIGITALTLRNTQITDITPIAGMTGITTLYLSNTPITDITPIAGMTGITELYLDNTQITDITPIAGMTGITRLYLDNTQITDLRPLQSLTGLRDNPGYFGLTFEGCKACDLDPRIAEIAAIEDHAERAGTLFDYLKDWVPPGDGDAGDHPSIALPNRQAAPLEVLVTSTQIERANRDGLPQSDANERARQGWEALKEYRTDFAADFNPSNYAPLPNRLAAFDRAMGEAYDPKNVIRIGIQAQRLVRLAGNQEFTQTLPTGAADDMRDLARALLVYVERFPDWVEYVAQPASDAPNDLETNAAAFDQIAGILETTDGVAQDVAEEYRAEVNQSQANDAGEIEMKALASSTRELPLELAEYYEKEQRKVKKRNNDLARAGGDLLEGAIKGPIGLPVYLIKCLGAPLSDLGDRGQVGLGWFARWYRLNFIEGAEDDKEND